VRRFHDVKKDRDELDCCIITEERKVGIERLCRSCFTKQTTRRVEKKFIYDRMVIYDCMGHREGGRGCIKLSFLFRIRHVWRSRYVDSGIFLGRPVSLNFVCM
jgi:hypothetical protein